MTDTLVMFNGKKCILLYQYSSDYCEIREADCKHTIHLVHLSELTVLEKK